MTRQLNFAKQFMSSPVGRAIIWLILAMLRMNTLAKIALGMVMLAGGYYFVQTDPTITNNQWWLYRMGMEDWRWFQYPRETLRLFAETLFVGTGVFFFVLGIGEMLGEEKELN